MNRLRRMRGSVLLALVCGAGAFEATANGNVVFQTVNDAFSPAPFFWAAPAGNIGWYWTPGADVDLIGIQTQLASGFPNVSNDYTFTTTLYTDRPSAGGVAIGTFTWNGATSVDGPWVGGEFDAALSLTGGTTYFIGMSGWEQGLADFGGEGGSGVNWINPPDQAGAESLGAGSAYTGVGFEFQMNQGIEPANVDSPILRFIAVPQPAALAIFGLAGLYGRRRRTAV